MITVANPRTDVRGYNPWRQPGDEFITTKACDARPPTRMSSRAFNSISRRYTVTPGNQPGGAAQRRAGDVQQVDKGPVTSISQVLSPIFPIAYALWISARCPRRDEHGPDDASLSTTGCHSTHAKNYETNPRTKGASVVGRAVSHVSLRDPNRNYQTNPRPPIL